MRGDGLEVVSTGGDAIGRIVVVSGRAVAGEANVAVIVSRVRRNQPKGLHLRGGDGVSGRSRGCHAGKVADHRDERRVRWVAGCSAGKEPSYLAVRVVAVE